MAFHRLRVLLNRSALDTRIAEGESPSADPRLALRANHLCSRRARRRVAAGLQGALTDDGRPGMSAAVPIDRRAIETARPYLAQLVEALRSPAPVAPNGVARALRLLTDARSPLYAPAEPADLRHAAGQALWELDPVLRAPEPVPSLRSDDSQVAT